MRDVIYEMARELLIPQAERIANMKHGTRPKSGQDHDTWAMLWNRTFHRAMDTMWKSELRRRSNKGRWHFARETTKR